jgi:hypothetical protein
MPSDVPSLKPSLQPSEVPSLLPSGGPSSSYVPSDAPTLTGSAPPSSQPSLTASGTPVATPSMLPSSVPSLAASVFPSGAPSSTPPTTVHPSAAPSDSMAPTAISQRNVMRQWEQPIFLNYFVVGAASTERESTTLIGGNLRGRRELQNGPAQTPLELLTAQHLLTELRLAVISQNADADQVVGVTVTVNSVKVQTDNNVNSNSGVTTTVTTHAVTGTVTLQPVLSDRIRTTVLRQMVDDAFTGAALDRYVFYLGQQSDTSQEYSSLRGVVQVTAGLPPDWSNGDESGSGGGNTVLGNNNGNTATGANAAISNGGNNNNEEDDDEVWSDNSVWIALIAGAGAAAVGLVVAGLLLVRRGRRRNNESYHDGTVGIADKSSKDHNAVNSKGKGGAAAGGDKKNKNKKYDRKNSRSSPTSPNSSSPNSNSSPNGARHPKRNTADMESVAEIDDDGTSLAELSHAGGNQASTAKSVYSYIDANLMDDQSIAQNSYQGMYGAGMAGSDLMDDQSLQSMSYVWSTTKGGGTGDYYNGATGAARNGDQLQAYGRDYNMDDDDTLGSASKNVVDLTPSKIVVGAEGKKNGNGFFIFADDDLSMMSDAAKTSSIPPPMSDDKKRVQNKYPQLITENKRERERRLEQAAMKVVGVVPKEKGARSVLHP